MAFDPSNPPYVLVDNLGGSSGRRFWMYGSTNTINDITSSAGWFKGLGDGSHGLRSAGIP